MDGTTDLVSRMAGHSLAEYIWTMLDAVQRYMECGMIDRNKLGEWLKGGLLITDGAWGTQLQQRGLPAGTTPDIWNLTHPDRVEAVARAYAEAGSQVVLTNTFRANAIAMKACSAADLDAINRAGVALS